MGVHPIYRVRYPLSAKSGVVKLRSTTNPERQEEKV